MALSGKPTRTHVVMPVRDELALTMATVDQLQTMPGWDRCWIYDNGSIDGTVRWLRELEDHDPRFFVLERPGACIYALWGEGLARAQPRVGDVNVAIINNDLHLAPETFVALAAVLRADGRHWIAYPNYDLPMDRPRPAEGTRRITAGTYRHGGMSGFCFMLAGEKFDWEPLIDPQFEWWCGDDDLAFTVEKFGGWQVRAEAVPVEHYLEGTARHHDLGAVKDADLARCDAKWGR